MVLPKEYKENASFNKKVIGKMKDELNKGPMSEFIALSPNVYAYQQFQVDKTLTEHKKARGTSKCVVKMTLSFDHYKKCLFNNETVRCMQYRIKSTPSFLDTVQINKITLKNSDNKRLRSFNGITRFPSGTKAFIVYIEELKIKQAFATYIDSQKLLSA